MVAFDVADEFERLGRLSSTGVPCRTDSSVVIIVHPSCTPQRNFNRSLPKAKALSYSLQRYGMQRSCELRGQFFNIGHAAHARSAEWYAGDLTAPNLPSPFIDITMSNRLGTRSRPHILRNT